MVVETAREITTSLAAISDALKPILERLDEAPGPDKDRLRKILLYTERCRTFIDELMDGRIDVAEKKQDDRR